MIHTQLTVEELGAVLAECAGADDGVDFTEQVKDVPFDELGYDSLALLEAAARIGRSYGVRLDDDQVIALTTPRAVLDLVNDALAEVNRP
jgi:act minimal PKS acyl carrier protein